MALFDPAAFPCHFVYHYKPAVLYRPQLQFFLRVENETMAEKRPHPSGGFYTCMREFAAISRKRSCERKPELLGTFEAERIVAKKFVKGKYMSFKQRLYLTLNLLIAKLLISPKKINLSNN